MKLAAPGGAGVTAPPPVREGGGVLRLAVDGAALELERHGVPAGPGSLVFLHEGLGSLTQWRGVPAEVCERAGRPGTAYARAGHGRSQAPRQRRGLRAMHHEAEVVLPELLARLGVERPVLVGHSDGASIALRRASVAPDEVAALVLLAPHVVVEDCTLAGIAAAGVAFGEGRLRRGLARHHDDVDAMFRSWHDTWLDPAFRAWDLRAGLEAIAAPVLLIQGVDDQYGTMAQLDEIAHRVRGPVVRRELAACGHSPHLDRREDTIAIIVEFLAGIDG